MEVQALTRYARMSPKKVREVARTIQGRTAPDAVDCSPSSRASPRG
jgi:large subunit ribosomal protein L22